MYCEAIRHAHVNFSATAASHIFCSLLSDLLMFLGSLDYPLTKSEGYSFGVVCASVRPPTHFVCPEPYLSSYTPVLVLSWYK